MIFKAVLSCVLAIVCDGGNLAADPTLPTLNYWYLVERLVQERALQAKLGLTPSQLSQIKILRVQGKFEEMHEALLDKQTMERRFVSIEHIWLEIDPLVYSDLLGILTEQQVISLRQLVLRNKYSGPLACFKDHEVLDFLEWRSQSASLTIVLEKEQAKYDLAVLQLKKDCLSQIHAALAPLSSDRLGRYCGRIEYSGREKLEDVDSIPYSLGTICEGVYFASQNATLPDKLKLSESQKSELKAIFRAKGKELPMTAGKKEWDIAGAQAAKRMRQLLSREQYVFLVQLAARNELCRDFRKAFEQKELLNFLEVEEGDIGLIQDAAEKQSRQLSLEMERLSEASFQNVANTLPMKQREKLLALFKGGWNYKR